MARRRNPSGGLMPLVIIGGVAFFLLHRNKTATSIPTSTSSPVSGVGLPPPVPIDVGSELPPASPMGTTGAGAWNLVPGGSSGIQWVWVGRLTGLFPPAPVPASHPPSPPPTPPNTRPGVWQLQAGGPTGMQSLGRAETTQDVVNLLGGGISPDIGLHDATGAGLVDVLSSLGISADHRAVSYDDVLAIAGTPVVMGGSSWKHWTGLRGRDSDGLLLANPAPGYRGVDQRITRDKFAQLGPFNAVVVTDASLTAAGNPIDQLVGSDPKNWLAIGAAAVAAAWALDWI